jgi:putative hydrolase of the HAD superfamily
VTSVDALLFDFGGTLDYPRHWLDRFLDHYRACAIELSRVEFDRAFDHATSAAYQSSGELERLGLTGLLDFLVRRQFDFLVRNGPRGVRDLLERGGMAGRDELRDRIAASFLAESRAGFGRSRAVLKRLHLRYRLAVVSNFYGNLDRVLIEGGLAQYVDAIIDSSRVGCFKPDPRIFETALNALGIDASNAVMVGDSLDKDCAPARRLGMRTVWLCTDGRVDSKARADRTIRTLDELVELSW